MNLLASSSAEESVLYLCREEVVRALEDVDIVEVVARALISHADGGCAVPDEAYLGWHTREGLAARSLAMPGAISVDGALVPGIKIINGSLANPARRLSRSQGFTMLFDAESARPTIIMEAAYISAVRTAAVTAVAAQRLGPSRTRTLALLGAGTLARAHLVLLPSVLPDLAQIRIFDVEPLRARRLAHAARNDAAFRHLHVAVVPDARRAVEGADLVVPVTTTTEGYLPYAWLKPGALIAHVSLDDLLPEVIERAELLVVDDWDLVRHDERRLLGRMYRDGRLAGPGGHEPPQPGRPAARRVDGLLGQVLTGDLPGRRADTDIVVCNPFGMSILDVALADRVRTSARERGLGQRLRL